MQDFFIFKDKLMMWYNMDVGNFKLKWMEYDEREERDYEKNYFLKVFFIELDDALTYPSGEVITSAIESYATECNEQLKFESKVKPITFLLRRSIVSCGNKDGSWRILHFMQ